MHNHDAVTFIFTIQPSARRSS